MTDQERQALLEQLLAEYRPLVPEGMELQGRDAPNPDILEFWITHRVALGSAYGGTFRISHEALNDGLDARPGLNALLERARNGTLPPQPAKQAAPLLFLCTSTQGLVTQA